MVQFVPYFSGQRGRRTRRPPGIQKCIRTPDIDEVGITTRHNTFFQMAGNFSFGDYFKRAAIRLASRCLTNSVAEGGYEVDPERIWATVYWDDDEAVGLWEEITSSARSGESGAGAWPTTTGRWAFPGHAGHRRKSIRTVGPRYGPEGGPLASEEALRQIWNLVFMQNERGEGTTKDDYRILGPLPRGNIDTGMGVKRVAVLLYGVHNVYETDLLRPVINVVAACHLRHRQPRR